jgi:hypothetical protein
MSHQISRVDKPSEVVNRYILDLERRLPSFLHDRRVQHGVRHDPLTSWYQETINIGERVRYDGYLQAMLTDEEHQKLGTDPDFTTAWRVFVDMCWMRKVMTRLMWIASAAVLFLVLCFGLIYALPLLMGPKSR